MSLQIIEVGSPAYIELLEQAAEIGARKAAELFKSTSGGEWVTKEVAMQMLGCEKTTLQQYVRKKVITVSHPSPGTTLYNRRSIIQHIEDNIKK